MTTLPDRILEIPDLYNVPAALGRLLDAWMPEYLAAIERQDDDLELGQLPRPRPAIVRHAGIFGVNDHPPAVVVWSVDVGDHDEDPDGPQIGTVPLGVMVVASAATPSKTTRVVHRYAAAVRAILMHHPLTLPGTAGPRRHRLHPLPEDHSPWTEGARGSVIAGLVLMYEAHQVYLGRRDGGPPPGSTPRDDPYPPWPPAPTVLTTQVDVIPTATPLDPSP